MRGTRRRTNLVVPLAPFVGRRAELDAIAACAEGGARVVTLFGPPGMGKTRLAMRYAELHREAYLAAGGVWFCDCSGARGAADACATVAAVLGVGGQGAPADVGDALAEAGRVLLVLDNLEQIAKEIAPVVELWCGVAPEAFVIVTSRERLGFAGEAVIELPPLAIADDAVELYRRRADASGRGESPATAAEIVALVRALDGIPLAIELAAARTRVLGVVELTRRLARGHDVLGDPRGATLRKAIAWSWELLSPEERAVLAQCSIFAGAWDLDAAEAILEVGEGGPPILDVLASLQDKSLVRSDVGPARFALYVSIREFAAEQAKTAPGRRGLAARHRRHYVDVTESAAAAYTRRGDAQARARLVSARENLVAIHDALASEALEGERARDFARVVHRLELSAAAEIAFEPLVAMLDAGIVAAAEDGRLRGELLVARGAAHGIRGDNAAAIADFEAAGALGRAEVDRVLEARALMMASVRHRHQGRFEMARTSCEAALERLEGEDAPRVEGSCRAVLGLLSFELGEAEASRQENRLARAIFAAHGDRWSEALALANLAQLDQAAGDHASAARGYDGALERFREHHDGRYESRYLGYRAGLELERGDLSAARALYGMSLETLALLGIRHTEALFRSCLGALEAMDGHAHEALAELDRADALLPLVDAPAIAAAVEVHRGQLDLALGRPDLARQRLEGVRFAAQSEDVRFAVRMLERALVGGVALARGARPGVTLTLEGDGDRFRLDDAPLVDLARRGSLRLLLLALVAQHERRAGTTLGSDALLAAGWPGERVLPSAGATRVRVAISTLRRLGLSRVLVTKDTGYALDAATTVRRGL
jgi:predicted ATPase